MVIDMVKYIDTKYLLTSQRLEVFDKTLTDIYC